MMDREKWHGIYLLVPRTWLPLIKAARGDVSRVQWIRELIQDKLKVKEAWLGKDEE